MGEEEEEEWEEVRRKERGGGGRGQRAKVPSKWKYSEKTRVLRVGTLSRRSWFYGTGHFHGHDGAPGTTLQDAVL